MKANTPSVNIKHHGMRPLLHVGDDVHAARVCVGREREAGLRDVGDEDNPGRIHVQPRTPAEQQRDTGHDHLVVPGHVVAGV